MSRYHVDLFNQLDPFFIGFDQMFTTLDSWVKPLGFPPHNILAVDDEYVIEVAVAGFKKADIDLTFENNKLTVQSTKADKDAGVQYQGIAKRQFCKTFTIAENIEVKDAKMEDGLLSIHLTKTQPKQTKTITIN